MLPYLYVFPIEENKTQHYLDYLNGISHKYSNILKVHLVRNSSVLLVYHSIYTDFQKQDERLLEWRNIQKIHIYIVVYQESICVC
jgi:hypothetical protein